MENITDVIYTLETDGRINYMSPMAYRVSGYRPEDLIGRNFAEFVHPDDLPGLMESYKKTMEGILEAYEYRIILSDGSTKHVRSSSRLTGSPPCILGVMTDVSGRKLADEIVRESETRFMRISSIASDIAFSCRDEGSGTFNIDWISGAVELITGYTTEEISARGCWRFLVVEDDIALFEKNVTGLMPGTLGVCEIRIRRKSGEIVWVGSSAECVRDSRSDNSLVLYGVMNNITERRRSGEKLRQSVDKYRAIFNNAPVGIVNYDGGGIIIDCNENFVRIIGSSREALVGLNVLNLKNEKVVAALAKSLEGETSVFEGEYRSYTADKTTLARMVCAPLFSPDGRVTGGVAITEDITERMRSGEELRFRSMVLDQICDLVTITDLNGKITYMNRASSEAIGRKEEELLGQSVESFGEDPERGATQHEIVETTLRDGRWRGEVVNYTPEGSERILDCRTQLVTDADGVGAQACGTIAEARVSACGTLLKAPGQVPGSGMFRREKRSSMRCGQTCWGMSWRSCSPVNVETWKKLTHPDDLVMAGALLEKHFSGELPYYECEFRMKHRDGRWIWMLDRGQVITRTADGKPLMMFGTHTDITDRRMTEEALRESERYVRSLLMAIPDLLIRCDKDGTCLDVITSDERKLYRGRDEALGRKMSELLPGEITPMVMEGIKSALESNGLQVIEYNLPMPHGLSWYEARIVPYKDDEIIALILDITERKNAEEKINSLLHEKELLLRETHHRVKNNMSTVFGLLSLQAECQEDPVCRNILSDAARRVQGMTLLYDKLYRSENYRELSVKEFLPPLVEEIVGVFRTAMPITADVVVEDFIVSSKTLTPIGIIVNELITNSIKHAFGTTGGGVITVRAFKKGSTGTLTVADDGAGIPEVFDPGAAKGFGLQLVSMLAKQLKGEFRITREGGTRAEVDFWVEER